MQMSEVTPGPDALKALSHPVRLRMLGLLRVEGPATATSLATRLGLNSGATSYHLRQLAQHGFIVDDAERGTGRERWWKAAHQSTRTTFSTDPAEQDAREGFMQAVAIVHAETMQRAIEESPLLPDEWRAASTSSDWIIRLTPAKARALVDAINAVVDAVEEDEEGTAESIGYTLMLHGFPRPGQLGGDRSEGTS